jgi:hypothetical protein
MSNNEYPQINLRSKNDLAKRIGNKKLTRKKALILINDVLKNFNRYWKDNMKVSEPLKGKYVRSAARNNLGNLLGLINKKVLAPHDGLLPPFIFGGISKKDHVRAAINLLGKKGRVFCKLDLARFFEQITEESVFNFFLRSGCSIKISKLLSKLCCIPEGPKNTKGGRSVLARGFSTSPRLSVWCNLTTFKMLNWRIGRILKKNDFKISIYVDDIGITASKASLELMDHALNIGKKIIKTGNLKINEEKTVSPVMFSEKVEYLGLGLGVNKVYLGKETQIKLNRTIEALRDPNCPKEIKESLKGLRNYEKHVNSTKIQARCSSKLK